MARADSSRETVGTNLSGSPQASNVQSSQIEERDEAKFSRPPAPSAPSTFAPSATAARSSTSSFSSSPPHSKAPSSGRRAAGMETNKGETWYGTETSAPPETAKDKGQFSADDSLVSSRDIPEKMNSSDENQRVLALRSLGVTKGASQDQRFGAITRSVRSLFGVPVSGLGLIENEVIYMHSRAGDFVCSAPPKGSFCDWTLEPEDPQILIVEDATKDPRFADHPFVKESPCIRFYAGYPLVGQDGKRYGTICIIDFECRSFAPEEYSILRNFADIAAQELERDLMHRAAYVRLEEQLKVTEHRSKRVLRAFDASQEPIALMDVTHPEWPIVYANPAWGRAVDIEPSTMRLCRSDSGLMPSPWAPFWHMFAKHSFDADEAGAAFAAVQSGASFSLTVRGAVNKHKVTLLQFKPVGEGRSVGENDMPEAPFSGGNNRGPLKKFSGAPRMTREQNAAVAAALAALSGATTLSLNERSEPERECTDQPSVAHRSDAAENPATEDAHDQASPVYYLGMVLHMESRYSNEQSSTPLSHGSSYHEAFSCSSVDHHDEEPPTTRHSHRDKDNGASDRRVPAKGHDIRDSTPQIPKTLEGDLKLGALIGYSAHQRCFQGSWHGTSVAVKVRSVAHIHRSTRETTSQSEKPTVSGSKTEMVKLWNDGSGGSRSRSCPRNERRQLVVPTLAHPSLLPVYAVHACVKSLHGSDGSSCEDGTEGKVSLGTIELWEIQKLADLGSLASNLDAGALKAVDGSDRVDVKVVLATAYDIACGMSYLHSAANRVHGCLTSSNVFLVSDASDERGWKAVVSEYLRMDCRDLVDVLLEDRDLTDACCPTCDHETIEEHSIDDSRCACAAAYLPPEVLGGRPVDRSTDVYSFGMVLWEMIEGRRAMPKRVGSGEVVPMGVHDEKQVADIGSSSSWPMNPLRDVIRDCVHVDCTERPSFKDLIPRLKELQRRMGTERS